MSAALDQLVTAAESLCVPLHDPAGLDLVDDVARARARWTSSAVLDTSALTQAATSGRRVEVIIGPAGSGKTTLLRALTHTWQAHHGPGSVVELAPSAAAADVLATSLGIGCENTVPAEPKARARHASPAKPQRTFRRTSS